MMAKSKKLPVITFMILSVFVWTSCADSIVENCTLENIAPQSLSKFSNIYEVILKPNCATAGCHSNPNPQADLDLSSVDKAYSGLVNVASYYDPAEMRVKPGASSESRLIKLLRRTAEPVMPPGISLESSYIDSIANWIDNGALNN